MTIKPFKPIPIWMLSTILALLFASIAFSWTSVFCTNVCYGIIAIVLWCSFTLMCGIGSTISIFASDEELEVSEETHNSQLTKKTPCWDKDKSLPDNIGNLVANLLSWIVVIGFFAGMIKAGYRVLPIESFGLRTTAAFFVPSLAAVVGLASGSLIGQYFYGCKKN